MEWNMLNESKKLFPHWLDKTKNSNFSKHLNILNNQQLDIRHNIKTVDWSRIIDKPLKIHKTQTEPYKWEVEFEVNIPRLKSINLYKNPTIVNNEIVNNYDVINGYFYNGDFYENVVNELTNLSRNITDEETEIEYYENFNDIIIPVENKYYFDLASETYYRYVDNNYEIVELEDVPQTNLIHSVSFIDNYSHFFRYTFKDEIDEHIYIKKYVVDSENNQLYKQILEYPNTESNGKYELTIGFDKNSPTLYYNQKTKKYCVFEDDEFVELDENQIIKINYPIQTNILTTINNGVKVINYNYYYVDDEDTVIRLDMDEGEYYIFTECDDKGIFQQIPIMEIEDITPVISNDKYVLEVDTWNDYHFLKEKRI